MPINTVASAPEIGLKDAGKRFELFTELGNKVLEDHRDRLIAPEATKTMRTWGIREASAMIGWSETWLRERDKDTPTDERGHRQYSLARINELREKAGTLYRRPAGSRPMKVAISNFKGGVAKTTTTIHLAQKCAMDGLRVLVCDFDPQASCTFALGAVIPDVEVDFDHTIVNSLIEDPKAILQARRQTYFHGIDLIPGNLSLADAELQLSNSAINAEDKLGSAAIRFANALNIIENDYDVILVDCGPNLGPLTINSLVACNGLLIPCPPQMYDLASMVMYMHTLSNLFTSLERDLDFFRILFTKHPGSQQSQAVENLMRQMFGEYIMTNPMAQTVELERASSAIGSIYETGKSRNGRDTYLRALTYADNVNNELIDQFKAVWASQAVTA